MTPLDAPRGAAGRPARSARLRIVVGISLVLAGLAVFGGALVVLGPLPDSFAAFAGRWAVRVVAALLVASGVWCAFTGWSRPAPGRPDGRAGGR